MAELHAVVTRHLEGRGMSLRELARTLHHDPSYLSKTLRGIKPCGPRLAQEIDDALEAGGEIIEAAARRHEPAHTEDPLRSRRPGTAAAGGITGWGMPRRDFAVLAVSAASLLDLLRSAPADAAERVTAGHFDGETTAGLENVMLGYRQIYQSAGASALLDPVCGTLHLLTEIAPSAGPYRDRVVSLIGQASSLAATMLMLDSGDYQSAVRYLALAARAARQSADDELLAVTMAARAFHSAYSGDPADGLAFASEAVTLASGAHPRTRGWVCAVASEMHATVGDQAGYERALYEAAVHVTAPVPDRQWKGIGAFTPAKLAAYKGGGLVRLRRYAEAQAVLLDALARLDPVQAKHRAVAHVDLADAYARDRKPDQAASHAVKALDIIETTRHAQVLHRAAAIYAAIRPTGTAEVRELGSRLLAIRAGSVR